MDYFAKRMQRHTIGEVLLSHADGSDNAEAKSRMLIDYDFQIGLSRDNDALVNYFA
jgi:hypothetical protein